MIVFILHDTQGMDQDDLLGVLFLNQASAFLSSQMINRNQSLL